MTVPGPGPAGGGDGLPGSLDPGAVRHPAPTRIGGVDVAWGSRTFVMGIVNVTPDSFSGDGLSGVPDPVAAAVAQALRMVADGADLIDVGGESTRPGHAPVGADEERARIVPVVGAIREALPQIPISIDTTKPEVAAAALDAGGSLINDIWGVGPGGAAMARLSADRGVPLIVMHNRERAIYTDVVAEVVADLRAALERAVSLGVAPGNLLVDPGIGFGKTAEHNLAILHDLAALGALGRPILLGTSRKSTLGRILDLPPEERLEATLATTALGIAAGVDIVRVHDVRDNVRVARVADAIIRGTLHEGMTGGGTR